MNNIDRQYKELLEHIIHFGVEKKDRTGTGTKSLFGWQIRHRMEEGFPLLTTKKMAWKSIVTELLWFLRGDTSIKYLVDNGCHIWDGDAWANYKRKTLDKFMEDTTIAGYAITNKEDFINKIKTDDEFANTWGELGPIYGKQWRRWTGWSHYENNVLIQTFGEGIDQIANLISELKTNPDSRRLMVNAWNVGELGSMVLPPCHYGFQVYTRELSFDERVRLKLKSEDLLKERVTHETLDKLNIPRRAISLMWNQRSVDTFLGLPFNIASYGLLLNIIAKIVNMVPEDLIGNLGDVHLYSNHIEQAKKQLTRSAYDLPNLVINKTDEFWKGFDVSLFNHLDTTDFTIENYQSHQSIKAPLSN
jgi:thymidylate synthase